MVPTEMEVRLGYLGYDLEEDVETACDFFLITDIYDEVRHFLCHILPTVTYFFTVFQNVTEPSNHGLKPRRSQINISFMLISSGILKH